MAYFIAEADSFSDSRAPNTFCEEEEEGREESGRISPNFFSSCMSVGTMQQQPPPLTFAKVPLGLKTECKSAMTGPCQNGRDERECFVAGPESPGTRKPSGLVRDSSGEFKTSRMYRNQNSRKTRLKLPSGSRRSVGVAGEAFEADGFAVRGGRLPLRDRYKAYLMLRQYVSEGKFRRAGSGWKPSTMRSNSARSAADEKEVNLLDTHVYVSLEGSIGVGKTTLCEQLCLFVRNMIDYATKHGYPFMNNDQVQYAKEVLDHRWLDAFLRDKKGMATLFQFERLFSTINAAKALGCTMEAHAEHGRRVHCIGDRLPLGNFAFALMHYSFGSIGADEFDLYGLTLANAGPYVYPDVLYLHCPLNVVKERIKSRARPGEFEAYTQEYLETLDEANLFVMLYMWYANAVGVTFIDWKEFQSPSRVLGVMKHDQMWRSSRGAFSNERNLFRLIRRTIRDDLLVMSYAEMKALAGALAWKVEAVPEPREEAACIPVKDVQTDNSWFEAVSLLSLNADADSLSAV